MNLPPEDELQDEDDFLQLVPEMEALKECIKAPVLYDNMAFTSLPEDSQEKCVKACCRGVVFDRQG